MSSYAFPKPEALSSMYISILPYTHLALLPKHFNHLPWNTLPIQPSWNPAAHTYQRTNPRNTISTTLYNLPGSVEYTIRIAKILARRMTVPVYVGCSIDPTALGLLVEEEMEGLTKIVEVIMQRWEQSRKWENEKIIWLRVVGSIDGVTISDSGVSTCPFWSVNLFLLLITPGCFPPPFISIVS